MGNIVFLNLSKESDFFRCIDMKSNRWLFYNLVESLFLPCEYVFAAREYIFKRCVYPFAPCE